MSLSHENTASGSSLNADIQAPMVVEHGAERPIQWSEDELNILTAEVDDYRESSKSQRHSIRKRVLDSLLKLGMEKREALNKEKLKIVSFN